MYWEGRLSLWNENVDLKITSSELKKIKMFISLSYYLYNFASNYTKNLLKTKNIYNQ